jgi:hypothetical protein
MKKRALSGKTRLKKKKRNIRILKTSVVAIFIICSVIGLAMLTRSNRAKIHSITISGNNLVPAGELKKIAESATASAFLGFFKKDNIVLYPKGVTEQSIANNFKSIQKVDISFKTANDLEVKVVEHKPSYLWCASRTEVPKNCFYMDDTGYIFSEAPIFSGNIFFIYYGLIDSKNAIGSTYLSAETLKSLKTFVEGIKTLGADPRGLLTYGVDNYELVLYPYSKIMFNSKTDFLRTFGNLEAVVKKQVQATGKDNFFKNLDYIDLRFASKAYFKMK